MVFLYVQRKTFPAEAAKSDEEVYAVLAKINPTLLMMIGYRGYAIIAWLMLVKPF